MKTLAFRFAMLLLMLYDISGKLTISTYASLCCVLQSMYSSKLKTVFIVNGLAAFCHLSTATYTSAVCTNGACVATAVVSCACSVGTYDTSCAGEPYQS